MVEMLQGLSLRVLGGRRETSYGLECLTATTWCAHAVESEEVGDEDPEGVSEQILLADRS